MNYALLFTVLLITACARIGGPITEVQPGIFSITHVMYANSPVTGVRQGVIDRAVAKCQKTGQTYTKLREEMSTQGTLDYTLFFTCAGGDA
jgi:hypothetical protein